LALLHAAGHIPDNVDMLILLIQACYSNDDVHSSMCSLLHM